jgi:hypothetical protein
MILFDFHNIWLILRLRRLLNVSSKWICRSRLSKNLLLFLLLPFWFWVWFHILLQGPFNFLLIKPLKFPPGLATGHPLNPLDIAMCHHMLNDGPLLLPINIHHHSPEPAIQPPNEFDLSSALPDPHPFSNRFLVALSRNQHTGTLSSDAGRHELEDGVSITVHKTSTVVGV